MLFSDLLASHENAPLLSVKDINLTRDEGDILHACLVHTILRIVVGFGGAGFSRFAEELRECVPITLEKIPLHKTETYPLPAMNIDELSTVGNAQVIDTIFDMLGYDDMNEKALGKVKIVHGDQLSVSRIRSVSGNRVGHDSLNSSYLDVVCGPGLFHGQLHAVFGTLQTHWGNPSLGLRDPGSLTFHNSVLFCKPIVLSSLPPYCTCRNLLSVSLYARVLQCLELVSGQPIDQYSKVATFEDLKAHAVQILSSYANAEVVQALWAARQTSRFEDFNAVDESQGNMVFENMLLFMRDALHIRKFTDAIKSGDSGRIVIMLKQLALLYCGTGQTKYAHKMLHLIHNLTHVWPKPLRYAVSMISLIYLC